ncbi:MAG: nucleoside triphosphate pyrophosphohydrolase [Pseudomonadota bacterium]
MLEVMDRLRHPATGCPWDVQQTFATIAPYTVEEAYEVADAIEREDLQDLREELGDLLFQVVFHARMANEIEAFDFGDVVQAIVEKMTRRHPHVFASEAGGEVRDATAVISAWEQHKAAERAAKQQTSLLSDVPVSFPALKRAAKLTKRAAAVGFDWPSIEQVLAKLDEEIAELRAELVPEASGDPITDAQRDRATDELGDVLFVLANLGRHLQIDPELALHRSNAKFIRRFGYIEGVLAARGERLEDVDLATMDALWDEAKERLG